METGFLNPIHDEEHFSSSFYNQGNGLDDTEHMLFGEMIVPEIIDYDNLWPSVDDAGIDAAEPGTRKEDFQKLLCEWQHQLTRMQESEAIKQIVPLGIKQEVSEMFSNTSTSPSSPTDPSIDELFPLESNKDTQYTEEDSESTEEHCEAPSTPKDSVAATQANCESEELISQKEASNQDETVASAQAKLEKEDQTVDVETVDGEIPLLLAGDLTSLLEQFEATEKVNTVQQPPASPSPTRPSSQTIRDALPAEVISRIKATRENHKKMISVIPAMPTKRPGRAATRMQDAGATLSRNKLLKLVGGSGGESVQLDHDYCTSGDTTSSSCRSYYMSDSSEYPSQSSTPDATYSRLPDYYVALAPHKISDKVKVVDTGSRKDSGLESGENSDDDVQSLNEMKSKVVLKSVTGLKSVNLVTESGLVIGSGAPVLRNSVPMVSVLKKNNIKVENDNVKVGNNQCAIAFTSDCLSSSVSTCMEGDVLDTQKSNKKKKKLNLEEYRVRREERDRIRSQESSRASSPIPCATSPAQPDSTTVNPHESVPKEKPIMLSVEVQTQTCDFIDLTSSKSPKEPEKFRMDRKEKRNDLKRRSYRSRHASSSSSSSADSDHHRSHRRKGSSRRNKRRRSSVSRMWSRSPSRSSSRSHSVASSSRSRSRSKSRDKRQKWRSRSPRRSITRYDNPKGFHSREGRDRDRTWQRGRSPMRGMRTSQDFGSQEKFRQVEERRVIYVGRIDEGTSKADLRKRFQQFGPIVDISVHFRERGDNYGFVTFEYKADAYKAVEHGNDDPKLPRYDLCFGGRRAFCKQRYADLDGLATNNHNHYGGPPMPQQRSNESFDLLLNEVKAQLRKRSSV